MELSAEQAAQFANYRDELYRQNESLNLTRVPLEECEQRHFIDSLLVAPFIAEGAKVLDLGTGPGLPAWPLACARPDLKVIALDGSEKTFPFLESVPLPNLTLVKHRAEEYTARERFDVVTGRALAPFPIQMELSAAWAKIGGLVIPFRTPQEEEEIVSFPASQLGLRLKDMREIELPDGTARLFPIYQKAKKTPPSFPRAWARMKARPLGSKSEDQEAASSP